MKGIARLKKVYTLNKGLNVGDSCECPSCGTMFIKSNKQQVFCKSKGGTKCKDYYWNNVTPSKRNNTTRISPRNRAYLNKIHRKYNDYRDFENDHIFSSEALGQD